MITKKLWLPVTALLLQLVAATTREREYQVHERSTAASDYQRSKITSRADVQVPMRIYLKLKNVDEGAEYLLNIADPASSKYAQHWTPQQSNDFFAPDDDALHSVKTWLAQNGISESRVQYSSMRAMTHFSATLDEAETLLDTQFHEYQDPSGARFYACEEYSLPKHVGNHVDFISNILVPGYNAPRNKPVIVSSDRTAWKRSGEEASSSDLTNCSRAATPECIRVLYNITEYHSPALAGNSLGIYNAEDATEGQNASYSQADLNSFYQKYAPEIPQGTNLIPASVDGGVVEVTDPAFEGAEPMLDYSISLPIIYPQNITAFVSGITFGPQSSSYQSVKNTGVEAFFDAIDASFCHQNDGEHDTNLDCGKYKPTHVLSFSYAAFEIGINYKYAQRMCHELLKLGLQGITVLAASGDSNVGVTPCGGQNQDVFLPEWFSTCPWVTSVGGTQFQYNATLPSDQVVEQAWYVASFFGTGGGFSNYYPRPAYQNASVEYYLEHTNLGFDSYAQFQNHSGNGTSLGQGTNGRFNRLGRAYPDVSALAQSIALFSGGIDTTTDGTSAATPLWASIITRINEERLRSGKSTVGFINPVLYRNPEAMNDITIGGNPGCQDIVGFQTAKGWDPVTGLGSPKFDKLLDVFMGLP